jgi:hypothetical protein
MKIKEELIYSLIFTDEVDYIIDISQYIDDIYKYDKFVDEIKKVLKKSKVGIIKEKIDVDNKTVKWTLKVKK